MTEAKEFTDLVVTVEGKVTMPEMDDFFERALQWGKDTGHYEPLVSTHESNLDGETFHSVKTERDILRKWFNLANGDVERLAELKADIEHWLRLNHTHVPSAHCRTCEQRTEALAHVVDRWAAG